MAATATFSVNPVPTQPVPGVRIQGTTPGLGNVVATGVTIPAGSSFSASVTADTVFPANQTKHYATMSITWNVSPNGSVCGASGCATVGTSTNPVYVTLAAPTSSYGSLMLTYIALGFANGGATSPQTAFQNTWNLFTARNVQTLNSGFSGTAFAGMVPASPQNKYGDLTSQTGIPLIPGQNSPTPWEIGREFACPPFADPDFRPVCGFHAERFTSIQLEEGNWGLVVETRLCQEIVLDSKFQFVSTGRLPGLPQQAQ